MILQKVAYVTNWTLIVIGVLVLLPSFLPSNSAIIILQIMGFVLYCMGVKRP